MERFGIAGIAGCGATLCVHPLDVIRINMQVDSGAGGARMYNGIFHCGKVVFETQGLKGLYAGIGAGIFRQVTYGMPRMAIYPMLVDLVMKPDEKSLPLSKKFMCGAGAGALASIAGVPSEVTMVRMAADAKMKEGDPLRRNYTGLGNALSRIAKEEGVMKLWEGTVPTMARAVLINAGQLAVYSEAKEQLAVTFQLKGIPLQFCASLVSAVAAVALSCPADVLKSRMQNSRVGEFSGIVECASSLLKNEGPLAFWKGYTPAVVKLAPHTVISFIILDNLSRMILGKEAL